MEYNNKYLGEGLNENDERLRLNYLVQAYLQQRDTREEEEELFEYVIEAKTDENKQGLFFAEMERLWQQTNDQEKFFTTVQSENLWSRIKARGDIGAYLEELQLSRTVIRPIWRKMVAVAAVAILMAGVYWIYQAQQPQTGTKAVIAKTDIDAPKTNKAMITLADGRTVILDNQAKGTLAQEEKVDIVKKADGTIAYSVVNLGGLQKEVYNKLVNPRGSQVVSLALSDGTKVWLNAESSLEYPIAFVGNTRSVKITGEAYFEVVHNSKQPFTVALPDGSIIEDLGTAFNIHAYKNEVNSKTTLIQGAVKLTSKKLSGNTVLKPGQQCFIPNAAGMGGVLNDADIEQEVAWKNGIISFHSANIQMMLNELERWYDIDVIIDGSLPARSFYADLSRTSKLSEVLKVLEINRIHCSLDAANKRLIVRP